MKQLWYIMFIISLFNCTEVKEIADYDFGYNYLIIANDSLPVIMNDSLYVRLGYSGCNRNHEFIIKEYFPNSKQAEVWLQKLTEDQPCDMYIEENRSFLLSSKVLEADKVMLLRSHDVTITLRE